MRETDYAPAILKWYDQHAREMPWRIGPTDRKAGAHPDPYRVWLSEIMLQQTTVAAVKPYFQTFTQLWPDVVSLAAAKDDDVMAQWAGLGYYARARNLLKCARIVTENHGGRFPSAYTELLKLPGVGPYTAAAVSSIAFDTAATVVDGNVERVMARLFAVETPLPTAKPTLTQRATLLTPAARPGDYAQAVMDLGATICTPRNPACGICPWSTPCMARQSGLQSDLPRKLPKQTKPIRHGTAYVARRADGAWLLERRPKKGLLGGMLGWPSSEWAESPRPAPPLDADWQKLNTEVRHTFTHFHLRLSVQTAHISETNTPENGLFIPAHTFDPSALPTVMRKVFDVAEAYLTLE